MPRLGRWFGATSQDEQFERHREFVQLQLTVQNQQYRLTELERKVERMNESFKQDLANEEAAELSAEKRVAAEEAALKANAVSPEDDAAIKAETDRLNAIAPDQSSTPAPTPTDTTGTTPTPTTGTTDTTGATPTV